MDSLLSLIGLMYKAKKLILGETILEEIDSVKFLFIASDASDKTKERFIKKCNYYKINYCVDLDSKSISNAIGKDNIKVLGVIDEGFKETVLKKIGGNYGKTNL